MATRKKKYLLLRGKMGNFIVVDRSWYDCMGYPFNEYELVCESDDRDELLRFKNLTKET